MQVRDSFEACHITAEFAAGMVPTRSSPDGAIAITYAKGLWGDDAPDEVPDFPDLADSDVPF